MHWNGKLRQEKLNSSDVTCTARIDREIFCQFSKSNVPKTLYLKVAGIFPGSQPPPDDLSTTKTWPRGCKEATSWTPFFDAARRIPLSFQVWGGLVLSKNSTWLPLILADQTTDLLPPLLSLRWYVIAPHSSRSNHWPVATVVLP